MLQTYGSQKVNDNEVIADRDHENLKVKDTETNLNFCVPLIEDVNSLISSVAAEIGREEDAIPSKRAIDSRVS